MKIIALLVCSTFVVFLLVFDRRLSKTYTFASWIPTLWLLYCASKPLAYWFDGAMAIEEGSIAEGSALDRHFLLVLIFTSCIVLIRRRINLFAIIQENKIIFILFVYLLVSIMWSDFMYVSFKRWVKTFGTIVISLVILSGPSTLEEFESILRRLVYITIPFSLLLIKYYPNLGVNYGRWSGLPLWIGVSISKNNLGVNCMVAAIFIVWHYYKNKKQLENTKLGRLNKVSSFVLMFITIWLLKGPGVSFSATSTICMLLGWVFMYMILKLKDESKLNKFIIMNLVFAGCFYLVTNIFNIKLVAIVAELVGRKPDLTGRDVIWEMLWPFAMQRPLIGTGFGGFWVEPLRLEGKLVINQAHNGYLDVLIQSGITGLFLLFIYLIASLKKAIALFKIDKYWSSFAIIFLLISLFHNVTESSYLMSTIFMWNIIVVNSIVLSSMSSYQII